jgi:hypothetical protein
LRGAQSISFADHPQLARADPIDARHSQDATVKKDLHRPRLSAIIPILTAAGSHPDCRAVLIQIVALYSPTWHSADTVRTRGEDAGLDPTHLFRRSGAAALPGFLRNRGKRVGNFLGNEVRYRLRR